MGVASVAVLRTLTWLHLSDFHVRSDDSYDRDVVLRALVASVRHFRETGRKPDVVFATGDVAYSGKPSEYEIASRFFDELLEAVELDRSRLFVIPGNHDVDRDRGVGLARTLTSREEADAYFAPSYERAHLTQKQAAFFEWYRDFFAGIRERPTSSCGPVELLEGGGMRVAVLPINSALFCQGEDDHEKLWVGRRSVESGTDALRELSADLRIVLIHHPLEWLADLERANIRAKLASTADVLLRGHLHETDVATVVSPEGRMLHLAAGAAYQTRIRPNRALYVTVEGSTLLRVFPIRYEDSPTEVWTIDPSVFPDEAEHTGRIMLPEREPSAADLGITVESPTTVADLIDGLQLGDDDEAMRRAYALLRSETRGSQKTIVGRLVSFMRETSSEAGDEVLRASSVLEAINRLDSSLIGNDVVEELGNSDDFTTRSSAATLLWDRAEVAPDSVPLGLLGRLALPSTEDWYVQAPAMAATKQLLLHRRAARIVLDTLAASVYADDRYAVAAALLDVASIDATAVPRDLAEKLAHDRDHLVATKAREVIAALGDCTDDGRDPRSPFGL